LGVLLLLPVFWFATDLNKHRRFKREFFETKQERRDKKITYY